MNLKELVTATIAQSKFKANRPFQISMEFDWGKIDYLHITEAHEGKGTHHDLKYEKGKWMRFEKPVPFGELNFQSWSHGCEGLSAWVIAENLADFHVRVYEAVSAMLKRYEDTISREMDKYAKACKLIEELKS